jgi:O-antigen ligase
VSDRTNRAWTERLYDRERLAPLADSLAVAVAVSLPWSTSATGILIVFWLIAVIPTLDIPELRRVLATPAGGLPVLLWLLAVVGTLWAFDISLAERWAGLRGFHKLLVIPLLIAQFQRSERARWVINGFVISCCILLVLSWVLIFVPNLFGKAFHTNTDAVPVKDYIAQSGEFTFCAFVLAALTLKRWREQRRYSLVLVLVTVVFLINVLYVAHSRTALVIIPVLLLLFAGKFLKKKKEVYVLMVAAALAGSSAFVFVPAVKSNITSLWKELREYQPSGASSRAGERLDFWRKSIGFIADAPIVGHGTGSIRDQFRRAVSHSPGVAALASENPHNQTFGVAIQLGLVGAMALFAMWISHFLLFRGDGMATWIGLIVVTENVVGSLFNSHLFDFTQGWSYVVGVGVAAGVAFKHRDFDVANSDAQSAGPVRVNAPRR